MTTIASIAKQVDQLLSEQSVFVLYKKNDSAKATLVLQNNKELYHSSNYKDSGFVFSPFDSHELALLFPYSKCSITEIDVRQTSILNTEEKTIEPNKEKEKHLALVTKTIAFIKANPVEKIVISRKEEHTINPNAIGQIFENMLNQYAKGTVYIWHHPKVGLWMGATPEKLIKVEGLQYKTMALAGTQIYTEECVWGIKEQQEQAFVTTYLENQLSPISEEIQVGKTQTLKAGHLAHICTEINGQLSNNNQVADLIKQLHPTPAVCGTPRDTAKAFILENENYDREFYTGFFGELNLENTSDLFVNLRCMQIIDNKAILYIGGGITAASNPEKEWEETCNKAKIMQGVLGN